MILFFLSCLSNEPAQTWSELPSSTYCSDAEVDERESCRVQECQNAIVASGAPSTVDAPALTLLCERMESSGSEGAQQCGIQACYYLPQVELSEAMRILMSSLPISANQKRARGAIIRGVLESDSLFALVLDSAIERPLKNSGWYGLAVAELDCTAGGVSQEMGLSCPKVTGDNVARILRLAESLSDNPTEYRTLLNMASAGNFQESAASLVSILTSETVTQAQRASAISAVLLALQREERLPKSLVSDFVQLCDAPSLDLTSLCSDLLR
jgi:hypothetical protein